jgi:8-oxo-dGTP pyrophosphatase MutT (NUDIX family)
LCELYQAEEIYTGAVREVKEETGVSLFDVTLRYYSSSILNLFIRLA